AGFNIHNNDGKKNSSLTFNYNKRNNYEKLFTDRVFAPDSILQEKSFTKYPTDVLFGSYSYIFPLGRKWSIDLSTSTSLSIFDNSTENISTITKVSTGQGFQSVNQIGNTGTALNFRSAVQGKLEIDSLGSEWINDIFFNFTK